MKRLLGLLAMVLPLGALHDRVWAEQPSFLVILFDDVGVDQLASYGAQGGACTPNIDAFAANSLRFDRAYANPICSATRAALLTGRHGFRTGLGGAPGLPGSELTLAEHLGAAGYQSAYIGKWHLQGASDPASHPGDSGFGEFRGSLGGALLPSYSDWTRTVNGVSSQELSYATTRSTIDALQVLAGLAEPFLLVVSLNAPHSPFHDPPAAACPAGACACPSGSSESLANYRAMLESLDAHLGVFVPAAMEKAEDLFIFALSDNGSPLGIGASCPRPGKSLVFEGGIRTPLFVQGPGITPGSTSALVHALDLFATLCELAGLSVPQEAEDSSSFAPVLFGASGARSFVFCERFEPNGFAPSQYKRAVLDARWKLVLQGGAFPAPDQLFDLVLDPCEGTNLLGGTLTPEQAAAKDALEDELERLGVG